MLMLLVAMVALFTLMTAGRWRSGIALMIVLAAVQDPIRKLTPETPGWMTLATTPVFAALIVMSLLRTRRWWSAFRDQYRAISRQLRILAVLCVPAALISATYSAGSWMLTLIGAFSYSVIFLALVAAFHQLRHVNDLRRLLAWYCVVHGIAISGAMLEYSGALPHWAVLGDDALGFNWVRMHAGYTVNIVSGFYRSGDVLGWHAATVCMLSLVLAQTGHGTRRWGWLMLAAWAAVALILCGRRKMVFLVPVFLLAAIWIYWQAGRATKAWSLLLLFALPAASVYLAGDLLDEESNQLRYYSETSYQTLDSLETHGFASLADTYRQSGFFGEGLGTATPGSHHVKVDRPRVWQESGTSRVLVELGVPGALGLGSVMIALGLALFGVVQQNLRSRNLGAHYGAGMFACFVANIGSLVVSGQILADPFIASFLGVLAGLTLSLARPELQGGDSRTLAHQRAVVAAARRLSGRGY
jgi:hypothetical protein